MSNYIEYNDKIAFHPGYYIQEIVENSGLTQKDFAKRLDTTPKNLSLLIRGEQSLSIDIAMKLSRMLGTSIIYWMNLQNAYDALLAEFMSADQIEEERAVFECLDYKYFRDNYGLPDLPRKINEQIKVLREFLNVSSLTVFKERDMAVSFRSSTNEISESNIVKANTMVQIAVNKALKVEAPKFNKRKFEKAVQYALTLTKEHDTFYPLLYKAFLEAGVIFEILPNLAGSKINGATKKIGDGIMLMVNDRRLYADSFWFTLFHEIGHIMNGDFGISFDKETGSQEELANIFAEDSLIPRDAYEEFVRNAKFDINSICVFAENISRAPGIVIGRLLMEKKVEYTDLSLKPYRVQYRVKNEI